MRDPTGVGFFGKLPGVGDFVQRRLSRQFVETWDQHFEYAVGASRSALGTAWHAAFERSPVWRFLLAPDVCTGSAWTGVMGPSADRVGRCFPMVLAAPLPPDPADGMQVLRYADAWFDALERAQRAAQADASMGIDAFDALVAALPEPLAACTADPLAWIAGIDEGADTAWRLALPNRGTDSASLAAWWARAHAQKDGRCLWWTLGAERVPPGILLTQGLPAPDLYTGFLDASQAADAWREPGALAATAQPSYTAQPTVAPLTTESGRHMSADAETTASQPLVNRAAVMPAPAAPVVPADDLSALLGGSPEPFVAAAPARTGRGGSPLADTTAIDGNAVLYRYDCELTLVAADEGEFDANRRAAAAARSIANDMETEEFGAGLQVLRDRLLATHWQLRQAGAGQIVPVAEDGAIAAVRVLGKRAALLRIGAAGAWHWRHHQLRPLFAAAETAAAGAGAGGDDLDDLLFASAAATVPGLGAAVQPQCDEVVCAVEPGDRLLLAATRRLVELPASALATALAAGSCGDARAQIARAAGLGSASEQWPLAVIEVTA